MSVAPFFRTCVARRVCELSVTVVLGGPNVRLLFGGQLLVRDFFGHSESLCSGVTIERSRCFVDKHHIYTNQHTARRL
jgi:hypothetical protein